MNSHSQSPYRPYPTSENWPGRPIGGVKSAPVPNEPSDDHIANSSKKVSAIGDELDRQVDFILADQQETIGKVLLKKRILTFVEEQTKLARLDELQKLSNARGLHAVTFDYVEQRVADLEASIKERSEE